MKSVLGILTWQTAFKNKFALQSNALETGGGDGQKERVLIDWSQAIKRQKV